MNDSRRLGGRAALKRLIKPICYITFRKLRTRGSWVQLLPGAPNKQRVAAMQPFLFWAGSTPVLRFASSRGCCGSQAAHKIGEGDPEMGVQPNCTVLRPTERSVEPRQPQRPAQAHLSTTAFSVCAQSRKKYSPKQRAQPMVYISQVWGTKYG